MKKQQELQQVASIQTFLCKNMIKVFISQQFFLYSYIKNA